MLLLMVVNVDWFFTSHRLPIALAALNAGYEVHIATSLTQNREFLEKYGFVVHPIEVDRSSAGAVGLIKLFFALMILFWKLKPDILHLVTIKPVLIGGAATRFSPVKGVVYAVSGLGHVFITNSILGKVRRKIVAAWYKFVLGAGNIRIIFQNPDDLHEIEAIAGIRKDQVVIIPGSGVDLNKYRLTSLPKGEVTVIMASRLLSTKGVREFVAAATHLKGSGINARFWLVGDPDPSNPASISQSEIEDWAKIGCVNLFGHRSDIATLMEQAHIVVLPSYREGLPKVLIEAAACGRVVVTTDVPGCRDAIEQGVTGVLVPAKDCVLLADAILLLIKDQQLCLKMGLAGRKRAEEIFDINSVINTHLLIYKSLENEQ